ncbi:MAG TPA: hypothetical protein V6C97_14850 [Oculatellaceae cyanobacterium]
MSKRRPNVSAGLGQVTARERVGSSTKRAERAQAGYLHCKQCGAEYHAKHWYTTDTSLKAPHEAPSEETLCPGCYDIKNLICNGTLVVEGASQTGDLRKEMLALTKHVETDSWKDNPKHRIIDIAKRDGKTEIRTTSAWLAARIGKELNSTFGGTLDIKPSPEKETAYVHWYCKS